MPDADGGVMMRLRSMTTGLKERSIAILHQDSDDFYDLAENLPSAWPARNLIGHKDADVLPPELSAILAAAKGSARRSGSKATVELELIDKSGVRRLFEVNVTPDFDAGEPAGVILVIADITETRERELALTSLMREVSHRSKNLLAIVQAVAMQTANHSGTTIDFLEKFRGRLHALADAQDLVTESNWSGTRFFELAKSQLGHLDQTRVDAITLEGINPLLGPNVSLHLGLAIHELATNALLHGALSDGRQGRVTLRAALAGEPDQLLSIEWSEDRTADGEMRAPPSFGTLVLERIVPLSVQGTAEYDFGSDQITYRLLVPLDQVRN